MWQDPSKWMLNERLVFEFELLDPVKNILKGKRALEFAT